MFERELDFPLESRKMQILKHKRKLIFLTILLVFFILFLFLSFKIWIYYRFNQKGNLLICSWNNSRIYEITRGALVVWSFELPKGFAKGRIAPPSVQRLVNGNTLITDHDAGMVYEVDRKGGIAWKCDTLYNGNRFSFKLEYPTVAIRITNGNTLVEDLKHAKVIEVDRNSNIVWEWDYINYDPGFYAYLVDVLRFDDGNTAVLTYKVIKPEKMAESNTIDFFEYVELDQNKRIIQRLDLDKIASHSIGGGILSNRHILISYSKDGVVEFDTSDNIVWSFQLPHSGPILYQGDRKIEEPDDAYYAFRFSNGNTATYSLCLSMYVVSPDRVVLWQIKHPTVKSILGVRYLKGDEEEKGDHICHLVGIVDK